MSWFRIDDGFPEHPKVLALEEDVRLWADAIALWVVAGCFASRAGTDGFIPTERVARLTPMKPRRAYKVADALCELARDDETGAALWERIEGGYRFHDFADYNPTADERAEGKRLAVERQRKWRLKRHGCHALQDASTETRDRGVTQAVSKPVSPAGGCARDPDPTRPDPTPMEQIPSASVSAERATESRARALEEDTRAAPGDSPELLALLGALRSHSALAELGRTGLQKLAEAVLGEWMAKGAGVAIEHVCHAIAEAAADIAGAEAAQPGMQRTEKARIVTTYARRARAPVSSSPSVNGGAKSEAEHVAKRVAEERNFHAEQRRREAEAVTDPTQVASLAGGVLAALGGEKP